MNALRFKVELVAGTAGVSDDYQAKWEADDVVASGTAPTRRAAMLLAEQLLLGSDDPLAQVRIFPTGAALVSSKESLRDELDALRAASRAWLLEHGGRFPESLWFDPRTKRFMGSQLCTDDVEFGFEELEQFATKI